MIRIATIGTSSITDAFIEAVQADDGARFVGTCSRSAERAAAFSREHGGTLSFTSVEELADCDEVDAVYVGSPNALHARQALTCIAGGKHVLVEKAFCANLASARRVFDAAHAVGVVAMEAMRPVHDPAFWACRDALADLGPIRRATLRFGKYSSRYDEVLSGRQTNIFDCRMASGALMDIGVYTVEPCLALFGAPESICAGAVLLDEGTRAVTGGAIDGAGVIIARYPSMVAELAYSKITNDLAPNQVEGERGTLLFDAVSMPHGARVELRDMGGGSGGYSQVTTTARDVELPSHPNTMAYELADFVCAVEAVRGGAAASCAPAGPFGTVATFRELTLAGMAVLDEARRQNGIVFDDDGR